MKKRFALLVAVGFGVNGCAHVSFSSDPDMKKEAHLHFYTRSIPYLLVAKGKDGVATSVFYLPDPTSLMYAQQHQGLGQSNLSMTLSNGVLTTYGLSQDSKVPETITAVSGLLGSAAGVATGAGLLMPHAGADFSKQGDDLQKAVTQFQSDTSPLALVSDAATKVTSLVASLGQTAKDFTSPNFSPHTSAGQVSLVILRSAPGELASLKGKTAIDEKNLNKVQFADEVGKFDDAKRVFSDTLEKVSKAIFDDSGVAAAPDFQLFEIKQPADGVEGKPVLRQIYPPKGK